MMTVHDLRSQLNALPGYADLRLTHDPADLSYGVRAIRQDGDTLILSGAVHLEWLDDALKIDDVLALLTPYHDGLHVLLQMDLYDHGSLLNSITAEAAEVSLVIHEPDDYVPWGDASVFSVFTPAREEDSYV